MKSRRKKRGNDVFIKVERDHKDIKGTKKFILAQNWALLAWYSLVKKKVKGPFWDLLYIYQTNKDYHIKWKYFVPCTSIYNFGKKNIHSLKPFGYNIQLKNQKFAQLRFSVYFFFDHPILKLQTNKNNIHTLIMA